MKRILFHTAAALALAWPAVLHAETEYSVFRVCQDERVIHTSDGAEAGRVEYVVVDPSQGRLVSTIISGGGGGGGERLVAVPFSSMRFEPNHGIVLTEITRERLASAPVIERTQITT